MSACVVANGEERDAYIELNACKYLKLVFAIFY